MCASPLDSRLIHDVSDELWANLMVEVPAGLHTLIVAELVGDETPTQVTLTLTLSLTPSLTLTLTLTLTLSRVLPPPVALPC